MSKLIALLLAGVFSVVTVSAFAANEAPAPAEPAKAEKHEHKHKHEHKEKKEDKKEEKKEEAK